MFSIFVSRLLFVLFLLVLSLDLRAFIREWENLDLLGLLDLSILLGSIGLIA